MRCEGYTPTHTQLFRRRAALILSRERLLFSVSFSAEWFKEGVAQLEKGDVMYSQAPITLQWYLIVTVWQQQWTCLLILPAPSMKSDHTTPTKSWWSTLSDILSASLLIDDTRRCLLFFFFLILYIFFHGYLSFCCKNKGALKVQHIRLLV